jgi:hypothetical protein
MIKYRAGYKYQLAEDYIHFMSFEFPAVPVSAQTKYLCLTSVDGCTVLKIHAGYAWDGPSGPTIDTKNFMRGSLVHDALYQLMRSGHLDKIMYRVHADRELHRICREDGMWWVRTQFVYWGVRIGGNPGARYGNENPVIEAPGPHAKGY